MSARNVREDEAGFVFPFDDASSYDGLAVLSIQELTKQQH